MSDALDVGLNLVGLLVYDVLYVRYLLVYSSHTFIHYLQTPLHELNWAHRLAIILRVLLLCLCHRY